MRIWSSYKDGIKAAETVAEIYKREGKLPGVLVDSYNRQLQTGYRGIVQKFYETLTEKAPEALGLFMEPEKYREE